MSAQYWSRKLEGAYVFHEGAFKYIVGLHVDQEVGPLDFRYPEEYLPFIKFEFSDGTLVRFEDFEIKFPEEGYRMVNGSIVLGQRNMKRAFRLGPSVDSFTTVGSSLKYWMAADPVQYCLPDAVFTWGEDQVFSPTVAAKDYNKTERRVYFSGLEILQVIRTKDSVVISPILGRTIPEDLMFWDRDIFGIPQPYTWPEGEKEPTENVLPKILTGTSFNWKEEDSLEECEVSEWSYYVDGDCISFNYENELYHLGDVGELEEVMDAFGDDDPVFLDMIIIAEYFGIFVGGA